MIFEEGDVVSSVIKKQNLFIMNHCHFSITQYYESIDLDLLTSIRNTHGFPTLNTKVTRESYP